MAQSSIVAGTFASVGGKFRSRASRNLNKFTLSTQNFVGEPLEGGRFFICLVWHDPASSITNSKIVGTWLTAPRRLWTPPRSTRPTRDMFTNKSSVCHLAPEACISHGTSDTPRRAGCQWRPVTAAARVVYSTSLGITPVQLSQSVSQSVSRSYALLYWDQTLYEAQWGTIGKKSIASGCTSRGEDTKTVHAPEADEGSGTQLVRPSIEVAVNFESVEIDFTGRKLRRKRNRRPIFVRLKKISSFRVPLPSRDFFELAGWLAGWLARSLARPVPVRPPALLRVVIRLFFPP